MRIYLVEDDEPLGAQLAQQMVRSGFDPHWIRRGDEVSLRDAEEHDLVVLDLMLPGAYGLDILRDLRGRSDVPILVLSAKRDTGVRVRALELGADDYVTKPFWPEELIARIQARLRRPLLRRDGPLQLGNLTLDFGARLATVAGDRVDLTRVEFDLLATLVRRAGAAVSRDWLVDNVLDPNREGTSRTLDVHVSRLRKKLGTEGEALRTIWGVGYRLDLSPAP